MKNYHIYIYVKYFSQKNTDEAGNMLVIEGVHENRKSIFSDKNIRTGISFACQTDIVHFLPPINAVHISENQHPRDALHRGSKLSA